MSTVSEIVQDSKLRSMSAAGGDTGDGMDDLLNWNNLTYKMPVTNSVVSARNLKTYPADRATYSWGPGGSGRAGPMFFHLQAGEQYIDWGKSFLRFTLQHTPECAESGVLTYGLGSACNFIETVIVTTRSGTEIHRCEQFNRWRAMQDRLHKPQHWFKQVGTMMGYIGDPDFNKLQMCDTIDKSSADIADFCLDEIATAGLTQSIANGGFGEQSHEYLIPLEALGGPFATGQLSPAVLAGGLIIELRLAPYLQAFTGFGFNAPVNITAGNSTENVIDNISPISDGGSPPQMLKDTTGVKWTSFTNVASTILSTSNSSSKIQGNISHGRDKVLLRFESMWDPQTTSINNFAEACCTDKPEGTVDPATTLTRIQVGDFLILDAPEIKWLRKRLKKQKRRVLVIGENWLILKGGIDTGTPFNYYDFSTHLVHGYRKDSYHATLKKGELNQDHPREPSTDADDATKLDTLHEAYGDFTGLSGYLTGDMAHDSATAPRLTDISIHLDTHLLNDAAMRALTQTSASDGLEIVYEEAFHQQAGVQTTQMDIVCSKAVSRALRVFGGLYAPSSISLDNDLTRPIGLPSQYFWRLGSIFFPNTPVSSELVAYHNLLYTLEQVDDKKYSSDMSLVTFRRVFPILCATFERSALLKYSGSAINNSRTLTISARLPQELVDDYADTGMQFHFWLEHLAVAKTFLNNCIVSI